MKILNEQYVKQSLIEFDGDQYRRVGYSDNSWTWYKVYCDGLSYIDNPNFTEELETEYQKLINK
jgi:hypothetical protein